MTVHCARSFSNRCACRRRSAEAASALVSPAADRIGVVPERTDHALRSTGEAATQDERAAEADIPSPPSTWWARAGPPRSGAIPHRNGSRSPRPRTTKEANRWRKQQNTQVRKGPSAGASRSGREYREALRRGDESVLPRRDKGQVRRLARDWVDTRRMARTTCCWRSRCCCSPARSSSPTASAPTSRSRCSSCSSASGRGPGRRIHALAVSRFGTVSDKPLALGLYAGQRAFMPRRWRAPARPRAAAIRSEPRRAGVHRRPRG